MKIKKAYPKILIVTSVALLLVSCQFKAIKGSGNVTTENRTVQGEFKSIDAEKGLDVVLEQAPNSSVTVIADDNLQKHIVTKVVNGVLKITSDYLSYINVKSKKIVVKMPIVESIQISSGSTFNARNTIKGHAITLKSSSGSSITMNLEAEKATCEASSGSDITMNGKIIDLEIAASSGSSIDAEKLLSNTIVASASSGSSIDVFPLVSLNAEASSGGSINYHNVPKNLNKKSSSGGSIDKE